MRMRSIPALLLTVFVLTGAISSCKDDPVSSGKDTCDTCAVDTTDTTDTLGNSPNDTTSHSFVWVETEISSEQSISGTLVLSDTSIFVLGANLYRSIPGGWGKISLTNQKGHTLGAGFSSSTLFGFSEKDFWIIHPGGAVWHYDGTIAFEFRPDVTQGIFNAGWGTSNSDMFFVGNEGTIVHYDGTTWKKFPKVTEKNLRSVWGTSHSDVWAAGFNSETAESVLLHFNGMMWKEIDVRQLGSIGAGNHALMQVWAVDSAGHRIVVPSGSLLWRKTDDGAWRSDSGAVPNRLSDGGFIGLGVRGNSINDMFAVGGWGFVAHWNGRNWKKYDELFNYGDPFYGTSGFSVKGNTAVAVGSKGGGSWVAIGRR